MARVRELLLCTMINYKCDRGLPKPSLGLYIVDLYSGYNPCPCLLAQSTNSKLLRIEIV